MYQCPNCGRIYNYGDSGTKHFINCMNCRYPLKPVEEISSIRHPELNEHKVIGMIGEEKELKVKCPYCHSANTKKISILSKAVHTSFFGIFSLSRNSKQWHCNNCNSNF